MRGSFYARRDVLRIGATLVAAHALGVSPANAETAGAGHRVRLRVGFERLRRYRLPNGLRIALEQDSRQPRVGVVVRYAAGSADDPPGYGGLAHLVEHMTFRGSRHLAPHEAISRLERAGATDVNGTTGRNSTVYQCVVPASEIETALWIEGERMAFTLEAFSRADFLPERRVVANELRERGRSPTDFDYMIRSAIFPGDHPFARESPSLDDLFAIELRHVRWFFQRWYRPDNASIALVGDFNPDTALALVKRYFQDVRSPPWPLERTFPRLVQLPAVRMLRCEAVTFTVIFRS